MWEKFESNVLFWAISNLEKKRWQITTQGRHLAPFFGDLSQSEKNSKIKPPLARGQKEEGQTLSQDVDCLMGSYMPPCPPWTDWYNCFHFFLYVPSAKTSESNLSDKQEGSNYVFQFIFCSFTIMDIPYMLKYLGMITILWHLVTLAKRRTANITCKF